MSNKDLLEDPHKPITIGTAATTDVTNVARMEDILNERVIIPLQPGDPEARKQKIMRFMKKRLKKDILFINPKKTQ